MKLKPLAAAVLLISGISAVSAATLDTPQYFLTYDDSTTFGEHSSSFSSAVTFRFSWTVPDTVQVVSVGGGPVGASFDLPSFTLTAKPGWALSAPTVFLGNLSFTEVGAATTGILAYATVSVDGSPAMPLSGGVGWTETGSGPGFLQGYFGDTYAAPIGGFTSLDVSSASIALSATGGSFASITAQPQNKFEISFTAMPVPEPETYAMLLAGLGALGWLTKRRQNQG